MRQLYTQAMLVRFWMTVLVLVLALGASQALAQATAPADAQLRPKVALVMAGGVARGFAYMGAMQELIEAGVPVDQVVGTSAGAMMGGLYSSGYSFEAIRAMVRELARNQSDLVRFSWPPLQGILDLTGFEFVYRELVGDMRLEDTSPPLAVMATELRPARAEPLLRGSLADAVRASISLPILFPVARFEGKLYVDGGLRNPLPADVARNLGASFVISVRGKSEGKSRPEGLLDVLSFTVYAVTGPMDPPSFDAIVPVKTFDTQYFDFAEADTLWERGRLEARQSLPALTEALRAKGIALNPGGDPHATNPVNLEWRARLQRGLDQARSAPEPFTPAPVLELPDVTAWNTRPGQPERSSFAAGVQLSGGPLGPVSLGGGYVELLDRPGGSGFVRFGVRLGRSLSIGAALDPGRRPEGTPWEVSLTGRGLGWSTTLSVDALAVGVAGKAEVSAGDFGLRFGLETRFGYAPSVRLQAQFGLEYAFAGGPWFTRARLLAGLGTGGAQGFSLGASSLMRAYPNDYVVAPQALATHLEFGYRWNSPNLLGLVSATPEVRTFADLGWGFDVNTGSVTPLWDVGIGATMPGRLFGFVPFFVGVDVGFGPGVWAVSLFTRMPF